MCGVAREVKDRKKERIESLCQSVVTTIEIFVGSDFFLQQLFGGLQFGRTRQERGFFFGALKLPPAPGSPSNEISVKCGFSFLTVFLCFSKVKGTQPRPVCSPTYRIERIKCGRIRARVRIETQSFARPRFLNNAREKRGNFAPKFNGRKKCRTQIRST